MATAIYTAKPLSEALRLVRSAIHRLTNAAVLAEPAPYWTDYLRNTRG